ncbi:4169_t:CDS:1, partial [Racocetra persica]
NILSRQVFNELVEKKSLARRKIFIYSDYELIIAALHEPINTKLGTPEGRYWIKILSATR